MYIYMYVYIYIYIIFLCVYTCVYMYSKIIMLVTLDVHARDVVQVE